MSWTWEAAEWCDVGNPERDGRGRVDGDSTPYARGR